MPGRAWTHDELLIVFRLYCRTPFGRLHGGNPEIVELARLMDRTPGAVAMKACNYASLDPAITADGKKGLANASTADRALWHDFLQDSQSIADAAEAAYAACMDRESGSTARDAVEPYSEALLQEPAGPTERDAFVKARRVQSFFRAAVLSSYENKCAITGLAIPELLNASHIVPWAADEKRRADPRNGLCLNALHDRAFDRGLIAFDEDMRLLVSDRVKDLDEDQLTVPGLDRIQTRQPARTLLLDFKGAQLAQPTRFAPDAELLAYHREAVFCG